jgi:UDP-glucuronate 4-epimerase
VRFLVTGAAGFIGSHLTARLRAEGHDVMAVDAFTHYYDVTLKDLNAIYAGGVNVADVSRDRLDRLVAGDGVFHLAGQPGVRSSWGDGFEPYLRHNVLATQRLFEAALEQGVPVVYASSSSVYGNAGGDQREDARLAPVSPYGVTKATCEQLAQAVGLDALGLRYFTVYGPRQRPEMAFARLIQAALDGRAFPLLGDGRQTRSFTFVDDAVEATVRAMWAAQRGCRGVVNVGGRKEVSLREAIATLEQIARVRVKLAFEPAARGDVRRTCPDTWRAQHVLDWQAETDLAAGLEAQWRAAVRLARVVSADT